MKAEDMVRKYCERNTVALFKGFLMMVEDLQVEHQIHFGKLRNALPEQYHPLIDQADYFDQDKLHCCCSQMLQLANLKHRWL